MERRNRREAHAHPMHTCHHAGMPSTKPSIPLSPMTTAVKTTTNMSIQMSTIFPNCAGEPFIDRQYNREPRAEGQER